MAELIPIEYRLRVATRQRLSLWTSLGVFVMVLAGASLVTAYAWDRRQAGDYESLAAKYHDQSALIARSHELRDRRQQLANRMQKIQELMDDKVLLALLQNISAGFSTNDCLDYVSIDAHAAKKIDGKDVPDQYVVHVNGITTNSTTLAELMTRLSKRSTPQMNVMLEASHREKVLDGQVMRFQIVCEKLETKGT